MDNTSISKQLSVYRLVDRAPPPSEMMLAYGYLCHIMSGFPSHQGKTVEYARLLLRAAMAHHQMKIFFDAEGAPVGFAVWAYLADETIARLEKEGQCLLHVSEFNEGKKLWLVDFLVAPGRLRHAIALLRNQFSIAGDCNECWYMRKKLGSTRVTHLERGPNGHLRAQTKLIA